MTRDIKKCKIKVTDGSLVSHYGSVKSHEDLIFKGGFT